MLQIDQELTVIAMVRVAPFFHSRCSQAFHDEDVSFLHESA